MTGATSLKAIEVLERAIDVINEGGWCQQDYGDMRNRNEPHCAYGAVAVAGAELKFLPSARSVAILKLVSILLPTLPFEVLKADDKYHALYYWNDKVCKDADEVIHLFKRAAEELR